MTRIDQFIGLMESNGIDLAIITSGANFRYLVGMYMETFERFGALIINAKERTSTLLLPKLDEGKAMQTGIDYIVYEDGEDPKLFLKKVIGENVYRRIGFENKTPIGYYRVLRSIINSFEDVDIGGLLSELRITKDDTEIKNIENAVNAIEYAIQTIKDQLKAGVSEIEIANKIRELIAEQGAEAKDILVQSGPNSAIPHWTYSKKKINEGDVVVIDVSATYNDYYGDLTRTFFVGKPTQEFQKIYELVKQAHDEAIEAVRSNILCSEIDRTARNVITNGGYGNYFIHRTGHGLGLEVHEEPYISQAYQKPLIEGSVFTIEPGIYLFGKFGVRIESNIAIKESEKKILDKKLDY
ncbi:MAG TPA: Xaa-Pro peptidase family protein [Geobacterales bacterium]|nr:Xaa-Pro peptidase family protein [Geobacterales bacterium]